MTNEEKILDVLAGMQGSMLEMRNDIKSIDTRLVKVEFKVETEMIPKQEAAAEGISAILEQLTPRLRIDDMENDIRFLKTVVQKMAEEVQQLKKAQ